MRSWFRWLDPRRAAHARRLARWEPRSQSRLRHESHRAVRPYLENDSKGFQASLARLREIQQKHPDDLAKAAFLPDLLEANECFSRGETAEAAARYRSTITRVEKRYRDLRARTTHLNERHNLEFYAIALGLLHNNLAEILAKDDESSDAMQAAYEAAMEYQPNLPMIRESYAYFAATRRGQWDEAERAYRDAHTCSPSSPSRDSEIRLRSNIASLRAQHAISLRGDDKLTEAADVLRRGISELESPTRSGEEEPLFDWQGKLHLELARVQHRAGRTTAAFESCRQSASKYRESAKKLREEDSPRAGEALESAAYVTELLAQWIADSGDRATALKTFSAALRESPAGEATARVASKIALLQAAIGERDAARVAIDDALGQWSALGWTEPLRKMVVEGRELLQLPDVAAAIELQIERRLRLAKRPTELRDAIEARRRHYEFTPSSAPSYPKSPAGDEFLLVVTPLVLEIDWTALDDAGGPNPVIDELAPEMRERVQKQYGVKLPGVRLRGNETDLSYGTYLMSIHEVPVATGSIRKAERLAIASRSELDRVGVRVVEETQTFDGQPACWIDAKEAHEAERTGLTVWAPMEVPLRHLESVALANLVEFVGHQEVQNLLETNELVGPEGDDIVAKEAREHMSPLTNVVRALVSERVPLTDFPHIYGLFAERKDSCRPWQIVEAIRTDPKVSPTLWGNDPSYAHVPLGPGLMAAIDGGVREPDGQVLALEPVATQEILTAVRSAIGDLERAAVVVPAQARRSVVRSLLALEHPNVPVLSMAELRPGLGAELRAPAELEGGS